MNPKDVNHRCLNKHLDPRQCPRSKDHKDEKGSTQEVGRKFVAESRFTE